MFTEPFQNVSGQTMLLKEFAFKPVSGGRISSTGFNIIFFGSDGDPAIVGDDAAMEKFCEAAFKALAESNLQFYKDGADGHWFLLQDNLKAYPMDDYPIVNGRGFNIKVNSYNQGAQVTASGAVPGEDLTMVISNGYQMVGNSMPAEIKLEDITIKPVGTGRISSTGFNIIFFGSDGDPAIVGDDDAMENFCEEAFKALSESNLQFYKDGADGHWFLLQDTLKEYQMDKYPIAPGRGFNVKVNSYNKGAEVTIPSPLQDNKEIK